VATAALVVASGHHELGDGVVGAALRATAEAKLALGFHQAVLLGVLCNALVCLAVWLSYSARSTTDRVLAVVPPVAAFVAAGFEHSVANMYFVPAAMFAGLGDLDWWRFVTRNLIPVTLGNIVGGSVLVGAMYWFVYLRGGRR
jgi:formate transporter